MVSEESKKGIPRIVNGDYDYGVIATLSIARVFEALIEFLVPQTYLAMNGRSSLKTEDDNQQYQ